MSSLAPQREHQPDRSIGRIVSITGAKAIVLLDNGLGSHKRMPGPAERPEMGTLFAIETANTVVLAIVSALSVPVPAQREGEGELWIAELGLVGELWKLADGLGITFNRGVFGLPFPRRSGARCFAPGAGAGFLRRQAQLRAGRLSPARCLDPCHGSRR